MHKQSFYFTFFLLIILNISGLLCNSAIGQTLTREAVRDTISQLPSFTAHKDNYFITGIPTNTDINSSTANAKYQVSFKQMISRESLPWDTYLFFTYSQKAFWDVFKESYPFKEINFNPTLAIGKAFFDKNDRLKGIGSVAFEHESNGRDSIFSRSWNRFSVDYNMAVSPKTLLSIKAWIPFSYNEGNPELIDYVGLGEVTAVHNFIPNKLSLEMKLRKGLQWNIKGMLRTRLYYQPFKNKSNQYFMLEWFVGHAESLIDYEDYTSMLRFGYVIKSSELNLLLKGKK
jgi:phospholipase A1